MGKSLPSLLVILLALTGPLCYSQSSLKVSEPRLEMVGTKIQITYDILNSIPNEKYEISIDIKDEAGNIIDAKALEGDIGENVIGGINKQIIWDVEADNVMIDAYILVKVKAWAIAPPAPVIVDDIVKEEPPATGNTKTYNRTGIILQSGAFPGLGLSRVTGKPHWIRGVAGYGCISASIVLNRQAIITHNSIDDLDNFDDIINANEKSVQQDNISEVFAYAAIGIWVSDLIWTIVGTRDLNKPTFSADVSGFSFSSAIDPLSNAPMVSVKYRF